MSSPAACPPLSGLTVLDLGQIYQGPYAAFLMAKAGAEVIKVEALTGEAARARAAVDQGALYPFETLNANKKGIALDLKSAQGKALFLDLVKGVDVLVENFAPGVMDRLGVGWETLRQINPRLIYASGTGFGLSGPDRDRLALDLNVQAVSGMMSTTGQPDGPPLKTGAAVADFMGGVHVYAAVMTALVERARTGIGQCVEVAMQETLLPTMLSTMGMLFGQKEKAISPRTGNRHSGLAQAPYNVYAAKDGYIALLVISDAHWHSLLTLIGRKELIGDARFANNAARVQRMDETDALIEDWTQTQTVKDIYSQALKSRIPCAPVRELSEVLEDPHLHERGMLQWVDHPRLGRAVFLNSPLRFHGSEPVAPRPSPELGEHTIEILKDRMGVSQAVIDDLLVKGVVRQSA